MMKSCRKKDTKECDGTAVWDTAMEGEEPDLDFVDFPGCMDECPTYEKSDDNSSITRKDR